MFQKGFSDEIDKISKLIGTRVSAEDPAFLPEQKLLMLDRAQPYTSVGRGILGAAMGLGLQNRILKHLPGKNRVVNSAMNIMKKHPFAISAATATALPVYGSVSDTMLRRAINRQTESPTRAMQKGDPF